MRIWAVAKSFQITNVFPQLTTRENIRIGLQALVSRYDMWRPRARHHELIEQADELLALVGLWDRASERPRRWRMASSARSKSEWRWRAGRRLLLLDEPTAGMSPEETRVMMDLIVKLASERTVILVEHKMKLVLGISDRILVLHHGELLAEGTPPEVRQNEAVKRVYLGQREH